MADADRSHQSTRLNDLSYGIKIWTDFFFSFVKIHAFDGQTDGRTDRILIVRPRLHSMQSGKNRDEQHPS